MYTTSSGLVIAYLSGRNEYKEYKTTRDGPEMVSSVEVQESTAVGYLFVCNVCMHYVQMYNLCVHVYVCVYTLCELYMYMNVCICIYVCEFCK